MDSLKKNLSFHLKEYRKHNSLSQEEAAEHFGISTVFYGEIERAKKLPSVRLLLRICKETGYDELYLAATDMNCTVSDNAAALICLIRNHPELSDTLLLIAQNLLNESK